jgi:uncharacterized protein (TIGR02271 family)
MQMIAFIARSGMMTTTNERGTIVAVFNDRAKAQQAINELKRAGFRDDQIGVTSREGKITGGVAGDGSGDNYAAEAGAAGLATGAGVGALWGLGVISGFLPAIGPAIAGGTLAAILSSAAAGAATAGLAGALIGLGIPKDEAEFYENEFKAGRTLVTLTAGARAAEGLAIMRRNGGYERSTTGAASGSATSALASSAAATSGACAVPSSGGGQTIQAREEQLRVQKQREKVGEVTVRKEVHTEHKTLEVPVEREEVVIERHPVSGGAATGGTLGEGQQIRVPVTEEHVEVTKTPVVKEEVTIGKRKVKTTEHVGADVRKEQIKVEKEGDACVKDNRSRQ